MVEERIAVSFSRVLCVRACVRPCCWDFFVFFLVVTDVGLEPSTVEDGEEGKGRECKKNGLGMIVLSRRDDKCVHVTRVSDFDGPSSEKPWNDALTR